MRRRVLPITLFGYSTQQLARFQVELEYDLTADGLLVPIDGRDERNLCSLYMSESGIEAFFRFDVPARARRAVAAVESEKALATPEELADVVGGRAVNRSET